MANQSKLKAWVRYDGTGRVISGGPIFQVNKPKVGNWKQIDANLCCNGTTGTTTTQGGGVTPTAFIQSYFLNTYNACNSTYDGSLLFYSASTTIQSGITVFTDAALTIPVTSGYVISTSPQPMQFVKYVVGTGGVLTEIYCQSSFYFGTTAEIACSQSSPAQLLSVAMNTSSINNGSIVYANFASLGFSISIGQTIYMRFSPGFAATVPVQVTSATTGTVTGTETECPSMTTTSTTTSNVSGFTMSNLCDPFNPIASPFMAANNFVGFSSGAYMGYPNLTEQGAIDSINPSMGAFSNSRPYASNRVSQIGIGVTCWLAAQDVNNPANIVTRSIVVTDCYDPYQGPAWISSISVADACTNFANSQGTGNATVTAENSTLCASTVFTGAFFGTIPAGTYYIANAAGGMQIGSNGSNGYAIGSPCVSCS